MDRIKQNGEGGKGGRGEGEKGRRGEGEKGRRRESDIPCDDKSCRQAPLRGAGGCQLSDFQ